MKEKIATPFYPKTNRNRVPKGPVVFDEQVFLVLAVAPGRTQAPWYPRARIFQQIPVWRKEQGAIDQNHIVAT
jgi:hypothetical protein